MFEKTTTRPKVKAIGFITRNGAVVYDTPKAPEATEGCTDDFCPMPAKPESAQ